MCLLPTFGTLSRVPYGMLRWCCARGNGNIGWQRLVVVARMRWMECLGGSARGKRKRGNQGIQEERKFRDIKGRSGGWGMVFSPWVSISSCLRVGLCALGLSSYCLAIPVRALPALTDAGTSLSSQSFTPAEQRGHLLDEDWAEGTSAG